MKSSSYTTRFLPLVVVILAVHCALVFLGVIPINLRMTLISDVVLLFVFLIGTPIVTGGLKKEKEAFVGSFLILTTLQMLSVMSVLGAFVYVKIPGFREVSLQMVSVFVIILIVQSYFLIKIVNNSNKSVDS